MYIYFGGGGGRGGGERERAGCLPQSALPALWLPYPHVYILLRDNVLATQRLGALARCRLSALCTLHSALCTLHSVLCRHSSALCCPLLHSAVIVQTVVHFLPSSGVELVQWRMREAALLPTRYLNSKKKEKVAHPPSETINKLRYNALQRISVLFRS